jgi:zinc-binding alcohol dehydrogenase family protein
MMMKAVGYSESLPITDERSLIDLEIPKPVPGEHDLLVRVKAISINPLDAVARGRFSGTADKPVILGWDAAGVVEEVGSAVTMFRPGDEVYYSGSLDRPGSNAEYALVDERVTALKPRSLSFIQAAAIPLTAITAWESLFDRLKIRTDKTATDDNLLIIGAAGGVGSMAVQLARSLTGLHVIGTASRPESREWVSKLGAHDVVDHSKPLSRELAAIGRPAARYVLSLAQTDRHWDEIVELLAPQGEVCIADNPSALDVMKLRAKAGGVHFEMMWVRTRYPDQDMLQIHHLLAKVAKMIDDGLMKCTASEEYGALDAANLRRAHAAVETGRTIGKIVLAGID